MGADGVFLGPDSQVIGVRAISNGSNGITVGNSSTIRENTISGSLSGGITAASDCLVNDNAVRSSGTAGVTAGAGSSIHNLPLTARPQRAEEEIPWDLSTSLWPVSAWEHSVRLRSCSLWACRRRRRTPCW